MNWDWTKTAVESLVQEAAQQYQRDRGAAWVAAAWRDCDERVQSEK